MASIEWLLAKGFRPAGAWDGPLARVHRAPWLRHAPGVYAFVVGNEVRYIGKAGALHRRLRNYSRRCFGPDPTRAPRRVHDGIVAALGQGHPVHVYALALLPTDPRTPAQLEAALIADARPAWNVSLNTGPLAALPDDEDPSP